MEDWLWLLMLTGKDAFALLIYLSSIFTESRLPTGSLNYCSRSVAFAAFWGISCVISAIDSRNQKLEATGELL